MTTLAVAPLWTTASSFDLLRQTTVLPIAIGRPGRSLPKHAFNAPRQQTASAKIPIASDARPLHTSRGFLVWGFVKEAFQ
jgi:hypothetical protein